MSDDTHRWSGDATAHDRHDVGHGVFANGTAQEIADMVIAAAREEGPPDSVERRAMAKLTFYENRAGKNLTAERRTVLEAAKAIVRAFVIPSRSEGQR